MAFTTPISLRPAINSRLGWNQLNLKKPYIAAKDELMSKKGLIHKTVETLEKLPEDSIQEIADFAEFMLKKNEEKILQKGIETMVSESDSFAFLQDEEDLYNEDDLKEKY
ncbi:DUF2281 domain-containing protein [Cyclobacterium xiamenense]|uniref:DUF2281 domain-containing protein n=1 Tax=Cyclobacterium xiamenense TaxID=1297121 RepID=UPI001F509232|nr:DUF2281 domain-containing protein [Cyclobacterium xiamenense]